MAIDQDKFVNWAVGKFGAENVQVYGPEVKINSIYDPDGDDYKYKLWCRPDGETKNGDRKYGVYHCWISGKKGDLVGLVMDAEKCDYDDACEKLGVLDNIDAWEEEIEKFFADKKVNIEKPKEIPTEHKILALPKGVSEISALPPWDKNRKAAESYLASRKIPIQGLYVGCYGRYSDRVVIPYYDKNKNLIYYNGRFIGSGECYDKYRGPHKSIGVGKGEVIFMPKWESPGCLLHITEGEFDAITLSLCGLSSCSVSGSHLCDYHFNILKNYKVVLCGDNDKPGANAVFKTGSKMVSQGIKEVRFVRPPVGFKDWNELYQHVDPSVLKKYVMEKSKPFNLITSESLLMS